MINSKGQFIKGTPPWNKGKNNCFKHTKEWKERMSKLKKGKKQYEMTDKIRNKISNSLKGKYFPPKNPIEKSRKISIALTGRKLSEEHRLKMIKALTGRPNIKLRKITKKTYESRVWRKRIEYRLWRESVFSRDNWTCRKCKVRGNSLHPHHIQNFSSHPELRFAIDNGITFCIDCHKKFHKIFSKKNNTIEQIKKYENIKI